MKIRQHIKVSGRVQGVGFRYTARNAATQLGITGWVRNEFDGTVSMEVQGEESSINKMFEMIEHSPFIEIDHMFRQSMSVNVGDCTFEVRGDDW